MKKNFYLIGLLSLSINIIGAQEGNQLDIVKSKFRSIEVHNDINESMITYNGGRAPFPIKPTEFKIYVNNIDITEKKDLTVQLASDEEIKVQYIWDFVWGMGWLKKSLHKEEKVILFNPEKNTTTYKLAFSFDKDDRISLEEIKLENKKQ